MGGRKGLGAVAFKGGFIRVRNQERFQHYTDRTPPWIKWHRSCLADFDFSTLPDAAKWHAVGLALLASECDNRIPADPGWIAQRIAAADEIDLNLLLSAGYIERCEPLAGCKQDASNLLERGEQSRDRGETETEGRRGKPAPWSLDAYEVPGEIGEVGRQALQEWLDYRKAAGHKRYALSRWIGKAWKESGHDERRLARAVEHSIGSEYVGLYQPNGKGKAADRPDECPPDLHPDDWNRGR